MKNNGLTLKNQNFSDWVVLVYPVELLIKEKKKFRLHF